MKPIPFPMKKLFTLMLTALLLTIFIAPVAVEAQTCPTPMALTSSNITTSTAQLSWTLAMTTSYSNLQYRPAGSANWVTVVVQQLPFNLGNLTCNTTYEWQVQAVCSNSGAGGGTSPYSSPALFTTLSCNTTCPAPTNPGANNVTATGAVLTWNSVSPAPGTVFNIQYHAASSPNWITINNVGGNLYQLAGLTCNTVYVFQVQTVCSNSATGVVTLSPWSQLFTFVTTACTNSCPSPTGLTVSNVSTTGAVLTWNSSAPSPGTTYNIQYQSAGTSGWITINNVSGTLYQLGGLTCNTAYIFQVQAVCVNSATNTTTLSPWSPPFTFITAACTSTCPTPTGLTATNVSATGAVLTWNTSPPSPNAFNIRYRINGTATWTSINNSGSLYQLGGLQCNTQYEWQVQAICVGTNGTTTLSPWSSSSTFTTLNCPATCPAPTAVATTNITAYSAFATWSPVPGAVAYSVRYRAVGSVAWIYLNSPINSRLITNLICGVQYQWQVRSICAPVLNNNVNQYSPIATFTTLSCNTNCLPPSGLTSANITPNSAQLSWNTTGAPMYRVRYRIPASGMLWIYQNTPATSIAINGLQPASPYEWQVQSMCNPNSNSAGSVWSPLAGFQTLPLPVNACSAPTGLTATSVSQQGGVLTWNPVAGAVAYNVRYKPVNSTLPYIMATANTNFLQIGNLTPGIVYEWQVQTVCVNSASGVTTLSQWSVIGIFTTPLFMNVYPNPADEVINISMFADEVSTLNYELRDMFGKSVISGTLNSTAGMNEFELQTSTVYEGWYSLTVSSNLRTSTARILIKH